MKKNKKIIKALSMTPVISSALLVISLNNKSEAKYQVYKNRNLVFQDNK
ncbi:UNVERIFIED_CONTAM: hypothetical protein O8I53_09210 [Campylobacter lari]